jgi:hypothetical protein
MIWLVAWLLAGQVRPPTVGDTIWLSTTVPVGPRMILRAQNWDLGTDGQVLGPPEVVYAADSATVRYPVAFWIAGEHLVTVPGPIVVTPEGRSDTLPNVARRVDIATVLPAGANKRTLAPRGPAARLAQAEGSLLPLTVALVLIGLSGGIGFWLWRRARRPGAPPPRIDPPAPDPVAEVESWARMGETRAALDGWSHLIEHELAGRNEPEAASRAGPLLEAMAVVGFRPGAEPAEADRLLRAAREWWDRRPR